MELIRRKYETNFASFIHYAEFLMVSQIFSNRIKAGWDCEFASNEAMIYIQKMAEKLEGRGGDRGLFEQILGAMGEIPGKYDPDTIAGFYGRLDALAEQMKQPEAQPA